MDKHELQQLINAKDWDALANTDILVLFRKGKPNVNDVPDLTPEFYSEFLFNKEYYFKAKETYMQTNSSNHHFPDNVVLRNFMKYLYKHMDFKIDDWKSLINAFDVFNNSNFQVPGDVQWHVTSLHHKNVEFIKALKDDDFYTKVRDNYHDYSVADVTPDHFKGLTPDEMKEIGWDTITLGGLQGLDIQDDTKPLIMGFFNDVYTAITKTWNDDVEPGLLMGNMAYDDYKTEFKKIMESEVSWNIFRDLTTYFQVNDVVIDDDFLDYMNKKASTYNVSRNYIFAIPWIIPNLSKEQVIKHKSMIPLNQVTQRDDFTIDEIAQDILGPGNHADLTTHRFFTEEEIRRYPELFNPERIKQNYGHYVTKDTFKMLNKAWGGKRYRYNEELTNFVRLINELSADNLTVKNLKYLKEKTGVSNELANKHIMSSRNIDYLDSSDRNDADRALHKMRKLFWKYEE